MKEINQKLDIILAKAGQINNYQFLVTFIFLSQLICAEFINQCLPFLERGPFVFIDDSKSSELITYDICRNESSKYVLDNEKSPISIVIDFNIFCDEKKILFLGFSIYIGMIMGSCTSYIFTDSIGRKKILIIVIPIYIIFLCTYKLLSSDFGEVGLNLLYFNFFISGFCGQIIVVTMIIYICEIIKQTNIPIFVIIIITGIPLSNLLGTLFFNIDNLDWRNILLIIAALNAIIYSIMVFKLVASPIFSLNNELFETFVFDLMELAKRNKLNLELHDFDFLMPYINHETRKSIRHKYNEINESFMSANAINRVSFEKDTNINDIEDEDENLIVENDKKKSLILKEDYLLNNDESEGKLKLFGNLKMKDYSPLDLIRFNKQIKNFLILSFLWAITMLIKNGINLKSKYIQQFHEELYWNVFNILSEIGSYFVVLLIFLKPKMDLHQSLVLYQIISFIIFMVLYYIDLDNNEIAKIVLLILGRLCWTSLYAMIFVITSIIYPIMIRTKGFGWNKAFGFLGVIIDIVLTEFIELKTNITVFLIFGFFSLVLSYGLPNKIGTFILESPSIINQEKEKPDDNFEQFEEI